VKPIHVRLVDKCVYDQAVASARARIPADAEAQSGPVHCFLKVARDRFLDPDINVWWIMREAGIRRSALHPSFHQKMGTTPWRYILRRRFEVAKRLLTETEIAIWKIGCLVGYPNPRTFSRSFKREDQRAPTEEAKRLRSVNALSIQEER